MKFRAVSDTDLLVSEVALALDGADAPAEPASAEMLIRLAYDEGMNFVLAAGESHPSDAAFSGALAGERRSKISVALRLPWKGEFASLSECLDARLRALALPRVDLLILDGVSPADLHRGEVGDAVHRLRVSGSVSHAGMRAEFDGRANAALAARNNFVLIEDAPGPRQFSGEERHLPRFMSAPHFGFDGVTSDLSFLWQDTGRTPAQAAVQFALSHPLVCSVFIRPTTPAGLKELARAPLAPPLSADEISAARQAVLQSFARVMVEA